MFRFSLPIFLVLIAMIAGPELAAQSKSEKQLKKAIFKKFEIDIEETKTRFAESDERGLGESFTESLMKSWEEATFEFLEDGNTFFCGGYSNWLHGFGAISANTNKAQSIAENA